MIGAPVPGGMGYQPAVTPVAEDMHWLSHMVHGIMVVIVLFVVALLAIVIFRFNSRRNPTPASFTHNTRIEIAWTLIPVVILIVIGSFSLPILFKQLTVPTPDLTVKATGNQWYWTYNYPANDVTFDSLMLAPRSLAAYGYAPEDHLLAADNALVVPVDKVVHVLVAGADVIHSFTVPAFGIKIDAVPGRLNETWFQAEREGIYFGQCSELCGKNHSYMPITVKVVSQEAYDAWLDWAIDEHGGTRPEAAAPGAAAAAPAPEAPAGAEAPAATEAPARRRAGGACRARSAAPEPAPEPAAPAEAPAPAGAGPGELRLRWRTRAGRVARRPARRNSATMWSCSKPRVMRLVVFTAFVGLVCAPAPVHPVIAFAAIVCIAVGAGVGGRAQHVVGQRHRRRHGADHGPADPGGAGGARRGAGAGACARRLLGRDARALRQRGGGGAARLHHLLLRGGLFHVAEAGDAAEHRHRRRGRRAAAGDRLGGGDGRGVGREPRHVRADLPLDPAALLGAGALPQRRLRPRRGADAAGDERAARRRATTSSAMRWCSAPAALAPAFSGSAGRSISPGRWC